MSDDQDSLKAAEARGLWTPLDRLTRIVAEVAAITGLGPQIQTVVAQVASFNQNHAQSLHDLYAVARGFAENTIQQSAELLSNLPQTQARAVLPPASLATLGAMSQSADRLINQFNAISKDIDLFIRQVREGQGFIDALLASAGIQITSLKAQTHAIETELMEKERQTRALGPTDARRDFDGLSRRCHDVSEGLAKFWLPHPGAGWMASSLQLAMMQMQNLLAKLKLVVLGLEYIGVFLQNLKNAIYILRADVRQLVELIEDSEASASISAVTSYLSVIASSAQALLIFIEA